MNGKEIGLSLSLLAQTLIGKILLQINEYVSNESDSLKWNNRVQATVEAWTMNQSLKTFYFLVDAILLLLALV